MSHFPSKELKMHFLTPLIKAKGELWYSSVPVGYNTLSTTVSKLCKSADIVFLKQITF